MIYFVHCLFSQSTPESWAQFTHDNITRAEHERMASIQLRTLIDNVLQDTSRDMREQADAVEVAFKKRIDEMQDAKNKLEENLKKVWSSHLKENNYIRFLYIERNFYIEHVLRKISRK